MKLEEAPITPDEFLLRLVRQERFRTNETPTISPNAFEPRVKAREPDTDGISLYRSDCLVNPDDILSGIAPERRHEYGIVRVSVAAVTSMDLSVQPSPNGIIPGHVVIPELNSADYARNQARFTPIKMKLADEASKDDSIVRWPGQPNV